MLVTVLVAGMNSTYVTASAESEIKKTAERLYKIITQKLPRIAWTVTKGAAALYAAYLAIKILPDLADDLSHLKDSHSKHVISNIFEHGCGITAFGLLAFKAGDSFLKDVEKL